MQRARLKQRARSKPRVLSERDQLSHEPQAGSEEGRPVLLGLGSGFSTKNKTNKKTAQYSEKKTQQELPKSRLRPGSLPTDRKVRFLSTC